MNRQQRRAMASGKMGQLTKALDTLQSIKDLEGLTAQMTQFHGVAKDAFVAVTALVEDHKELSYRVEALEAAIFRVTGPVARDVYQEELRRLREAGE